MSCLYEGWWRQSPLYSQQWGGEVYTFPPSLSLSLSLQPQSKPQHSTSQCNPSDDIFAHLSLSSWELVHQCLQHGIFLFALRSLSLSLSPCQLSVHLQRCFHKIISNFPSDWLTSYRIIAYTHSSLMLLGFSNSNSTLESLMRDITIILPQINLIEPYSNLIIVLILWCFLFHNLIRPNL